MPHEVSQGKHPGIIVLRYYGNIENDDIITNPAELHLSDDNTKYLLVDAGSVNPGVPEQLWERVNNSIIFNERLLHISIYLKSNALRLLIGAVVKLTRQRNRVSLHNTFDDAETHLLNLIE